MGTELWQMANGGDTRWAMGGKSEKGSRSLREMRREDFTGGNRGNTEIEADGVGTARFIF